jgi:hypothetical protein
MSHPHPLPEDSAAPNLHPFVETGNRGLPHSPQPKPKSSWLGFTIAALFGGCFVVLLGIAFLLLSKTDLETLRGKWPSLVPSSSPVTPPPPATPNPLSDYQQKADRRFRSLATTQANSLVRIKDTEAEVAELRRKMSALARENEDITLRLEMLSRDFRPIPDAEAVNELTTPVRSR